MRLTPNRMVVISGAIRSGDIFELFYRKLPVSDSLLPDYFYNRRGHKEQAQRPRSWV